MNKQQTKRNQRQILIRALVKLRNIRNITQRELAERLDVPQSFISKVENGERRLDFIELVAFVEALDEVPRQFIQRILKEIRGSNESGMG